MNKEEQIEEMAKVVAEVQYLGSLEQKVAELLYEQGYRKQSEGCDLCKEGNETCATCARFFDYYDDGGSDSCYTTYRSKKCVFYRPMPHCPKCGAKMRKEDEGK